ncbi:MAG: prepilin-type N-terminal cleavage/methylation domain-containing protein [Elusimicrobia bacterium]|nr:prepilin-type N-terminal cleavage/methylation domain-containing protein [Elusimicrobiota bacterium]
MSPRGTRRARRGGFTLIELLVVVLIIGILSAMMIPQYNKTVENSRADDAAGVVTMIGQANRMYYLDNSAYADGTLTNTCNSASCPTTMTHNICELVACHYLGARPWDSLSYTYKAGTSSCGGSYVACATRSSLGNPSSPYSGWGYNMDTTGTVSPYGGAPTPQK